MSAMRFARLFRVAFSIGANALGSFGADERAATAVEFAIVSVPFLALVFCIIELGVVLLLGTAVEATTQRIARLIKTGQLQQYNIQGMDEFRSKLLCPSNGTALLPPYLVCSRVTVDIRTTDALSDAGLSRDIYKTPSAAEYCLGGPQSIVVVRVAYAFPAILPLIAIATNGSFAQSRVGLVNDVPNVLGWNHILFKAAAFQNEAYSGSSAGCS